MFNASFIVYMHSDRLGNLQQMLRFLEQEPIISRCELIIVCQDTMPTPSTSFAKTIVLNLKTSRYNKSKMCNLGVNLATAEHLVILDSDRIIPPAYFTHWLNLVQENQAITTKYLIQLDQDYSDQQIKDRKYGYSQDDRSPANEMHVKNIMSGNTILTKKTYERCGKMNEAFSGYGFADTHFAKIMEKTGVEFIFDEITEIHLYHPHLKTLNPSRFQYEMAITGGKYCKIFHIPLSPQLQQFIQRSQGMITLS